MYLYLLVPQFPFDLRGRHVPDRSPALQREQNSRFGAHNGLRLAQRTN